MIHRGIVPQYVNSDLVNANFAIKKVKDGVLTVGKFNLDLNELPE